MIAITIERWTFKDRRVYVGLSKLGITSKLDILYLSDIYVVKDTLKKKTSLLNQQT